MSATAIDVKGLVRVPWKSGADSPDVLDCWHLMRRVLARVGKIVPADFFERTDHAGGKFERIGDTPWHASELGDVVETRTRKGDRHVSALVALKPKRFLTTSEETGSIPMPAAALEKTCVAVWRWVP